MNHFKDGNIENLFANTNKDLNEISESIGAKHTNKKTNKPKNFYTVIKFSTLGAVSIIYLIIAILKRQKTLIEKFNLKFNLIEDFLIFAIVMLILSIIFEFLIRYIYFKISSGYSQHSVYSYIISKNFFILNFSLAFVTIALIQCIIEKNELIKLKQNTFKFYYYISFLVSPVFIYILTIKIIIDFTNYKINFENYKDMIEENNKYMEIVKLLNNILMGKKFTNTKLWAEEIFNTISNKKNIITIADAKKLFNNENLKIFLQMFDFSENNYIDEDEFIGCFVGVIEEKFKIKTKLVSSDACISKFRKLLYVLFLPIIGVPWIESLLASKNSTFSLKSNFSIFFSLSFIFGGFLSEAFQNIFFVLFVRPFEVGDMLIIDGKNLTVKEIGLLYSLFEHDTVLIGMDNTKIRGATIENLRYSKQKTEIFKICLKYEIYKLKVENIKNSISKFLCANKKIYKTAFEIHNIQIKDDANIEMDIKITIKKSYFAKNELEHAKNKFKLFLQLLKDDMI